MEILQKMQQIFNRDRKQVVWLDATDWLKDVELVVDWNDVQS